MQQRRWDRLVTGLRLKQTAFLGFVAVPVVTSLVWWSSGPLLLIAGSMAVVVAIVDFAGRIWCLESHTGDRFPIFSSVICQALAIGSLVTFATAVPVIGLPIGLVIAFALQFAAAVLFTTYLGSVASALGDSQLAERTASVRKGLFRSLTALTGLQFVFLAVLVLAVLVALPTAGYGLYLALPIGGLALLPAALIVLWRIGSMYRHYSTALTEFRNRFEQETQRKAAEG